PDGEWYAPWMGATSPNGFFSGDSIDTGQSQEYYLAGDKVQPGTYYVVINYFEDSGASDQAQVTYFFIDPANGVPLWSEQGAKDMNLDNPAPEGTPLDELNQYSDWWYPGSLTREDSEVTGFTLDAGDKTINVIFRHKKSRPGE
ncbi:MAG: hypothetical protein SVS15_09895, partial [Thermodesulfobacteriota bacterium]|nr:hypothetical protein [Thermodesulfobacteriota bacterium]